MFIGTLARWKEDKKYFPDALNTPVYKFLWHENCIEKIF